MSKRSSLIRVGLFVVLGGAAMVVGVFLVGKEEGLFRESFRVTSYFTTIEGLRAGGAVGWQVSTSELLTRLQSPPRKTKSGLTSSSGKKCRASSGKTLTRQLSRRGWLGASMLL